MAAPGRFLVCLVTVTVLLLTSSPALLRAALARVSTPPCHCAAIHYAHAGPVAEFKHDSHHDDEDDADDEDEENGDGTLTEKRHCPCCPLTPRCPCGGCFLVVHAPLFTLTAQPWLPALPCLTSLS